ncbi:MAG: YfhO family protein [Thermodesulfobacteriota bacterium]|nr:YfhO family protein [Thermodesulfobacteriota bacterium]
MIERIKRVIRWVRTADFWAVPALFISSLLFFYDLFGERYLLTERDLAPYFIPPRFFWVESLRGWDFPLWNPYQFSGQPFFANPQHAVLYPLNSLFFLLPFDIAFNAIIILHFSLAGLFVYLFLRDLKVSSTGSLISGLILMLSGYLLSVHSLLTILLSVIWTPLIMMFFRRAMERPGIKNEILTAVFMTISFLGGGIEIVYGNFFVLLVMMFLSMLPNKSYVGDKPRRYILMIRSLLTISFSFLILSAIQLLPFLELWIHSIRGTGISYQEATVWSFAPKDILLFFLPDAYGYFLDMKKYWITQCWLKTMYTGGLPFILSLIFFLVPHPDPLPAPLPYGGEGRVRGIGRGRMLFLSLMLFSLFLSLGQYNPLYPLVFKYVPFFNGIRYPVKFLYIFILALAITAGLGFERLMQFSKERNGKGLKHLLIAFSLISGFILLFLALGHKEVEHFLKLKEIDFPQFNHLSTNLHHTKRFFFYLTLFFLLLRVGYEVKWKGWTKVLLVFFLTADLFGNMGFYGKEKSPDYFKKTKILEIITSDREIFRTFSTGKTIALDNPILVGNAIPFDLIKEKHLPSLNMIFHVHDIWGVDVVRLKKNDDLYKKFISLPSISSSYLIDVYGVKYVISVTPLEEDPRFELIYARLEGLEGNQENLLKQNTIKLYRNKSPLPRAWLVREFKVMDSKEILLMVIGKDFRPDREVLLEEGPPHVDPLPRFVERGRGARDRARDRARRNGEVEFISESNNRLSLKVEAKEGCILILSDTHYPGWKVFVNGKEEKILRANYNFRAVSLSRGVHRVEFVYAPLSFKLGAGLSIIGVISCAIIGWSSRRRKN